MMRDAIGVFGGATQYTEAQLVDGYRIGREIASAGFALITGATRGVPLAAAAGAWAHDGLVIGISPAASAHEHMEKFQRPTAYHDIMIFTAMGLEGRQPLAVRSVRGGIFVGGEFGTLTEFALSWTIGIKVAGVLRGSGGLTEWIPSLVAQVKSSYGCRLIVEDDAVALACAVCTAVGSCQQEGADDAFGAELRTVLARHGISEPMPNG